MLLGIADDLEEDDEDNGCGDEDEDDARATTGKGTESVSPSRNWSTRAEPALLKTRGVPNP